MFEGIKQSISRTGYTVLFIVIFIVVAVLAYENWENISKWYEWYEGLDESLQKVLGLIFIVNIMFGIIFANLNIGGYAVFMGIFFAIVTIVTIMYFNLVASGDRTLCVLASLAGYYPAFVLTVIVNKADA